ncbi:MULTISPECIES: hypothetical protein [unclassified Nocardia]|uniref:hypothetical protein n=1 Tax=unclassified Nocardia TaxID=2637762 RepID=UPI001CE488BD|nr:MULTISPECIES: hypothetical protein [unclassified Nocardia]
MKKIPLHAGLMYLPNLPAVESMLNSDPRIRDLSAALRAGKVDEASERLNSALRDTGVTVRIRRVDPGSQWTLVADGTEPTLAEGLFWLAYLVHADGWRRVKTCAVGTCSNLFVDKSNGCIRKMCETHQRRSPDRDASE